MKNKTKQIIMGIIFFLPVVLWATTERLSEFMCSFSTKINEWNEIMAEKYIKKFKIDI